MVDSRIWRNQGRRSSFKVRHVRHRSLQKKKRRRLRRRKRTAETGQAAEVLYASTALAPDRAAGDDAGGKDGAIEHRISGLTHRGARLPVSKCRRRWNVARFLWRIHDAAPPERMIAFSIGRTMRVFLVERVRSSYQNNVEGPGMSTSNVENTCRRRHILS